MKTRYNAYGAKFAREAKKDPTDWIIQATSQGDYILLPIGKRNVLWLLEALSSEAKQKGEGKCG